jgi:hypothetical protein
VNTRYLEEVKRRTLFNRAWSKERSTNQSPDTGNSGEEA